MNVEKDKLCMPTDLGRRLRLRKDYKESIDNKTQHSDNSNNESKKNDTASTPQSSCDEDSIMDFKSPKRKHLTQLKITNNDKLLDKSKKKISHSKPKIINNERKNKNSKSLKRKNIPHNIQQPSIESSFFKSEKKETDSPQSSADVKTAYVCPLCFKNLKDESSQAVHMKSCAIKNNVSTKMLIDAVELQERQAAERKSLGLLSAPVLQDKKKSAPRKAASHDDPDLQLALALSKSLYEKEEMEEWDEVQIVAISSSPSLPDDNTEYPQKATLQNFGFTSNRTVSPTNNWPTNKIKRRRPVEPTILQKRTAVERERILTERIAEILMGCKDFTQRSQEEQEQPNDDKERILIKSRLLQQLHRTENTLWDRTRLTQSQNAFYVEQLSPQITPLEKKERKLNEERDVAKFIEQNLNNEKSSDNEQKQEMDVAMDNDEKLMISSDAVKACCKEKKFLDSLATSWRNMLNDSSASDIIIFVKNSRHIWTHKLVFYVRCTNILLDIIPNDTEFSVAKEKICWIDIDYDVALAFLEFVYCGVIDRHSKILDSDISLSGIRHLARKYKVNDVFVYLRQKEFRSNLTEIKHDHNICEKNTENVCTNMEKTSNISKLGKSTKTLQEDVSDNLHSLENNYISTKEEDSCIPQDEEALVSSRLSEKLNNRSNTPANWEITASPDMFDETPDVTKRNEKFTTHSEDHEDSNIHMLLSLIKQDRDADICSQRSSTRKTQSAEYSELDKNISACLRNVEQDVMEIDSDSESNSLIVTDDMHKNPLIDTPQSSKPISIKDCSSNVTKQKSNLSLFIEKMQKENAKSDSDLDSDIEYPIQTRRLNPFHVNKHDNSEELQSYDDNVEQSGDAEKKPSRLSVIEQRMRSYANKNPEFYSLEHVEDIKRISTSHMASVSPKKTMKSSHSDISNYAHNFTSSDEKDANISEQIATVLAVPYTKTTNQLFSEISDLEANDEEISMYSKYMKDHKDNSIAKYREAIRKSGSVSDLSKSTLSDPSNENSDTNEIENDEVLTQSVSIRKNADINVSSDTESIFSSVSIQNNDCHHETIVSHSLQQSRKITENSKQSKIENEESSRSSEIEEILEVATDTNKESDTNNTTKSNRDTVSTGNTEMTSDDMDFSVITRKKSTLNDSSDDRKKESIPSPIMVSSSPDLDIKSSSPDYLSTENWFPNVRHGDKSAPGGTDNTTRESRKSVEFSFNFEKDIYLANVDIDRYETHVLEKSQSASILNVTEFKKDSAYRRSNENNDKNIKDNNTVIDDVIPDRGNLDRNAASSTQNSASIRKFKRKSLSEGQINANGLRHRETTLARVQFKCNYNHCNIKNTKTAFKTIDKDVTPPPDYDGMSTPKLNKEMKRYGLKLQKRSRTVKLLTHIYNELHPLVPITEITRGQEVTEILSDDDEGPPMKKRNVNDNSLEKSSNAEDNDDELLCSQDSNGSINSVKATISKEMEFYETESLPILENSSDVTEAFTKLINVDKDLHNKILRYEPVNIEHLRSTLRAHGFKCKLSNLMSFLDEQCITFYAPEQSFKSRTRRKA